MPPAREASRSRPRARGTPTPGPAPNVVLLRGRIGNAEDERCRRRWRRRPCKAGHAVEGARKLDREPLAERGVPLVGWVERRPACASLAGSQAVAGRQGGGEGDALPDGRFAGNADSRPHQALVDERSQDQQRNVRPQAAEDDPAEGRHPPARNGAPSRCVAPLRVTSVHRGQPLGAREAHGQLPFRTLPVRCNACAGA